MDGARATATGTGGRSATDGGSRPGAHGVVAPLARRLEREHRDAAPHRDPAYIEGKLAAVRAYTRIFSPEVRGIGNWIRHQYDKIDPAVLWETVTKDLPMLKSAV